MTLIGLNSGLSYKAQQLKIGSAKQLDTLEYNVKSGEKSGSFFDPDKPLNEDDLNQYGKSKNSHKTVAIVDNFEAITEDIDGDGIPDVSHGEVVENFLRSANPDVEVIRYDVSENKKTKGGSAKKIKKSFEDIAKRIKNGEKIDGVNLSMGNTEKISTLNRWIKGKINNNNIDKKEDAIRDSLYWKMNGIESTLESIEKVTAEGVPVYTGAGNDGAEYYNTFGLAKGVTQVGSTTQSGNPYLNSGDNSDVKRWEQGVYNVKAIQDKSGKVLGYDYTGDGKIDLSVERGSNKNYDPKKMGWKDIMGTSFASPKALGEDI